MRNPSENFKNRAETAREADTGIDTLFEPQIRQLGGVLVDAAAHGRQGLLWLIDPAVGKGSFWYFPIGDRLAVGAFDFALREEGGFFCDAADCFYFGSYSHEMLPYLGIEPTLPDRTVLGHAWKHAPYHQRVQGGARLSETFVALLPEALRDVSLRLHCDPVVLSSAIAALDGTSCPAGLPSLLDDMRRARPSAVVAEAFYESKVVEACALIVDWRLAYGRAPVALSADDVAAVAAAQRLIQQDLAHRHHRGALSRGLRGNEQAHRAVQAILRHDAARIRARCAHASRLRAARDHRPVPGRYRRMRGLFPSGQLLRSVPCPVRPLAPGVACERSRPPSVIFPKTPLAFYTISDSMSLISESRKGTGKWPAIRSRS